MIQSRKGSRALRAVALLTASVLLPAWSAQALAQQAPPNGLPDRGVLRLQLGTSTKSGGLHAPRRFVHEPSGLSQALIRTSSCGLELGGPLSLGTFAAAGGNEAMGASSTGIGVYNGSTGISCGRFSAALGESVTFGLGPDLAASPLIDANAFWRLSLDIEVKGSAELLLQVLAGGAVASEFRLRAGGAISPFEGSTQPGSPDNIFNCTARTDGVQDLGGSDNCRWQVDALGDGFRLVALSGEGALEGGGDHVDSYDKNSFIWLTEGDVGALGCESPEVPQDNDTNTIGDGTTSAQCGATRVDPTGLGGTCTAPIAYALRTIEGEEEGCELVKPAGEQLAASIEITFPPEPSTPLGEEPRTFIDFPDGAGGSVEYLAPACTGTVVPDSNGEPTILEVLSDPGFVADVAPGTPEKDWGCILESERQYTGSGQMVIRQTILFWGDPAFSRK